MLRMCYFSYTFSRGIDSYGTAQLATRYYVPDKLITTQTILLLIVTHLPAGYPVKYDSRAEKKPDLEFILSQELSF